VIPDEGWQRLPGWLQWQERSIDMVDFNSVLDHARQLSPQDQAKLIDALWDSVPEDVDIPLHPEWGPELERRVAALQAVRGNSIPWTQIRAEALARIGHGTVH
jgi:putative addiction module component (TIGR02574 family)